MSSPSTPRSTRSASAGGSNIITPRQKIKAMMAEFDSSDDDDYNAKLKDVTPKPNVRDALSTANTRERGQARDSGDDLESEEDIRPKGRMAARMQGISTKSPESDEEDSAFARVSKALRSERAQAEKPQQRESTPNDESSDDDLPTAGPRRKTGAMSGSPEPENEPSQTPPRLRSDSPLFVSPGEPRDDPAHSSDEENDMAGKPRGNTRFLSLVAQKRKEREEREKIEAEKKAARRAQMEHFSSEVLPGEESSADDSGSAHKLSQKARQPRKASKKARDEMRQETQRMSRNMQLAHQAQTKKKITKESLFVRFNFMQPESSVAEQPGSNSSSTAGSQNSSAGEARNKNRDTPHTSPVLAPFDDSKATTASFGNALGESADVDMDAELEHLPTFEDLLSGKGDIGPCQEPAAQDVPISVSEAAKTEPAANPKRVPRPLTQPIRVLMSRQAIAANSNREDDSDSDLEVVTSPGKCRRIAVFENLPTRKRQEDPSMTRLKALAHLTSPTRKMASMTSAELSASLLYKARQQAAKERRERIEELRAKGVIIETAEEREAMENDMENLVEKARKEADEIARREKAAKRKANPDYDEDKDDDYQLSGSDEEGYGEGDDEEEDEDEEEEERRSVNGQGELVDQEADEDDASADEQSEGVPSDAENEVPTARRKRRNHVVSDDEDEDQPQPPSTPVRAPNHVPQSAERPKFPGMGTPGDMSMGLTQAFASTLDGNGPGSQPESATIPFSLPDPGRPVPQLRKEESEILVRDSQEEPQEKDFMEGYSQNITTVLESPAPYHFSEYSQLPDPTQDQGFVFSPFDPAKRFRETPPMSTVDTVLVNQSQSPIVDRKRKSLRRGRATELPQVDEDDHEGDFETSANAFDVLKKNKATEGKPVQQYDKKTSKAKDIVDEAAEESEDEYAGLGGNSDDSDGEEDAIDRQMINDNSGEVVDEKQLAALNAIYDRTRDEKDVAKLMRDITTGALRRRKNADDDFDLDDSDDELLARRREKQREFAKMRRALLVDEKIGEIADNPKKAAFFRAVEDREVDDDFDIDFLNEEEGGSQAEGSQEPVSQEQSNDASNDSKKRKRPLEPSAQDATNRPPPSLRRTRASAMSKKPATLAEIRETLSFLTETFEYDSFHEDASLDEAAGPEEEQQDTFGAEDAQADDLQQPSDHTFTKPSHPRRTRGVVVDRLALLRQASSNSATATTGSGNGRMAFQTGHDDGPIGFRPPQLLRRVTTSSSSSSSSTTFNSNRVAKAAASGFKKGGAVNSYTAAREREREKELRMKQRSGGSNIAKLLDKHTGGGLGALGTGQWD